MGNPVSQRKTRHLASLYKAARLLDVFCNGNSELSLSQISEMLDTNRSSIYRILITFEETGFIERKPGSNKYRLGLKLLNLATCLLHDFDLRAIASPFMEQLAGVVHEIVHLSLRDGKEIVYIEKRGQSQPLTISTSVGGRSPAHSSAMGKVLLSDLSKQELTALFPKKTLPRLTPNTIVERAELIKELQHIKEQGYALDNEESFLGIRCVAAPILDSNQRIVASVSVSAPVQRMDSERIQRIRARVIQTAHLISMRMKGFGSADAISVIEPRSVAAKEKHR